MIVYKIKNKLNGKCYIGQSIRDLSVRLKYHKYQKNSCPAIYRALNLYGLENFDISVLAVARSIEELNELEIKFIQQLNTLSPNGYNLSGGGKNHFFSEEARAKMSAAGIGRKRSVEACKNISEGRKGIKFSEEHKIQISRARQGKKLSQQTRIKMSKPRLTSLDVRFIDHFIELGYTRQEISVPFNVSTRTIGRIDRGETGKKARKLHV